MKISTRQSSSSMTWTTTWLWTCFGAFSGAAAAATVLWTVVVGGSLFVMAVTAQEDTTNHPHHDLALAAYLPDYRMAAYLEPQLLSLQWNVSTPRLPPSPPPVLTDLILFSIQPHSKGFVGGCCLQQYHFDLLQRFREQVYNHNNNHTTTMTTTTTPSNSTTTQQKTYYPLTVWVTVGGSGRSEALPTIFANDKLRRRLIQSMIRLCKKHDIQGIDVDYFPASFPQRDQFNVFLSKAIDKWHQAGLKVSLTTYPGVLLIPSVYQQIDRMHIMTYDMTRQEDGDTKQDAYHASLVKSRETLEMLLQPGSGMDRSPSKLLLGIPAYAKHLERIQDIKSFGEIYDIVLQEQKEEGSNTNRTVDWNVLHNWNGYEWESGQRIKEKIHLAQMYGLGGVYFWEVGQDKWSPDHPRGMLLETAAAAIRGESLATDSYTHEEL